MRRARLPNSVSLSSSSVSLFLSKKKNSSDVSDGDGVGGSGHAQSWAVEGIVQEEQDAPVSPSTRVRRGRWRTAATYAAADLGVP